MDVTKTKFYKWAIAAGADTAGLRKLRNRLRKRGNWLPHGEGMVFYPRPRARKVTFTCEVVSD